MTQYKMVNGNRVEMTQAEIDEITQTPAQTLADKKAALIAKQKSDLAELATALSSALLEDGAEEQSNIALLRAKRDQVRSQFQADMIALITGGV